MSQHAQEMAASKPIDLCVELSLLQNFAQAFPEHTRCDIGSQEEQIALMPVSLKGAMLWLNLILPNPIFTCYTSRLKQPNAFYNVASMTPWPSGLSPCGKVSGMSTIC